MLFPYQRNITTPPSSQSSTPSRAPSPPSSTPSRAAPTPPKARPSAAPKGRPSPKSPPGFPNHPLHPPPPDAPPHLNHPILFSNLIMLNQMFGGADNRDNVDDERRTLVNIDEEGTEDPDQPQFTYRMSDDSRYQTGHGRTKCRQDVCSRSWEVPDNCGFAADVWQLPSNFRPCSKGCRGAFCPCINKYSCG